MPPVEKIAPPDPRMRSAFSVFPVLVEDMASSALESTTAEFLLNRASLYLERITSPLE